MQARIYESTTIDAKGAHVVAAFPSMGLVATIAANYLIERLGLAQVGMMDGPEFPTISVVQKGEPLSPVRIYAGEYATRGKERQKIVVFISEFQPNPDLVRPVAEAILAWSKEKGAEVVVSPEGLVVEGEAADDGIVEVYAIGSTEASRQVLQDAGIPLFNEGIVAGVTGILLNLGRREHMEVIGLLSEARKDYPDARSAATVIELLAQVVDADLDVSDLYEEARAFEQQVAEHLKRRRFQDGAMEPGQKPSVMYG